MKAKIINGIILRGLPKYYKHWAGGFDTESVAVHQSEGFYDVVTPDFDADTHYMGDIYFDAINLVFTYPLILIILPTLEDAKSRKITELKDAVKDLYQSIQWYMEMKRMNDEAIPTVVKDKIKTIKTKYEQLKNQINALTTVLDVLKFKLPYDQIESLKSQLESIE